MDYSNSARSPRVTRSTVRLGSAKMGRASRLETHSGSRSLIGYKNPAQCLPIRILRQALQDRIDWSVSCTVVWLLSLAFDLGYLGDLDSWIFPGRNWLEVMHTTVPTTSRQWGDRETGTHTHERTHAWTHAHAHTHTRAHTHTQSRTHTHTHSHTHTHTHTHTHKYFV